MKVLNLRKYLTILACALLISITIVCTIKKNTQTKTVSNNIQKLNKNEIVSEDTSKYVFVDVKGRVKSPGVYKLSTDKIVMDAINSAGGLEDNADTTYINLSKKLIDEMVIYIFSSDEIKSKVEAGEINSEKNETLGGIIKNDAYIKSDSNENTKNNNDVSNNSSSNELNSTNNKDINETDQNTIININTASKEELMNLSGIGEAKAQNIINYRIDNGNFNSIDDIKNVTGIGDSIFEKIKNDICI